MGKNLKMYIYLKTNLKKIYMFWKSASIKERGLMSSEYNA